VEAMTRSTRHPWLNRFAWLTAIATFLLLGLGGLVTSHEAGMSVPDWPTTYGYNMFLFPLHLWQCNIFYEHTHRLLASLVGFLTTILAVWLWLREPRAWLRRLGMCAFFVVALQGLLGGLRVTLLKDQIGIVHAILAQSFFVLVTLIALFVSGVGSRLVDRTQSVIPSRNLQWLTVGSAALILIQLILGATMRHQHAGVAVPDFPLAYGKVWPRTDAAFLQTINSQRLGAEQSNPVTAFQIDLHMAHRFVALTIVLLIFTTAWQSWRECGADSILTKLTLGWAALVCLQAVVGATTVWSNKAADIATAHVLLGALSLLTGTILSVVMIGRSIVSNTDLKSDPSHSEIKNNRHALISAAFLAGHVPVGQSLRPKVS
jgi:cytochrome c oxidase assembly protein subunit 15